MLQCPKEYNLLNEEELEYTGGGSDADFMLALAAGGLAGVIVSSVVYILNGENIRNRKKQKIRKSICRIRMPQSASCWLMIARKNL